MNRREFLKNSGIATLLIGICCIDSVCNKNIIAPNIIIIMADDLGYGDLGCYGSKTVKTPNIDKIAAEGLKFTDYHSNGAVCSPTRAALLTGRYQQRSGIEGVVYANGPIRDKGMPISEITFADVFKSAGYSTGLFGKWHLGYRTEFNPVDQGFDVFRGYVSGNIDFISHVDGAGFHDWWHNKDETWEEGYTSDLITQYAVTFIEENKDKSFLAYIAHEAPHYPYQNRTDLPVRAVGKKLKENERSDIRTACTEMIEIMDEGIGKIVSTVKKLGLEKKTFIFFCSDNGAVLKAGSNGVLSGAKGGLLEGGQRVPAIAFWPGKIKSNTVSNEIVLSMDIFPTIVAMAGIDNVVEIAFDGRDVSPVLFKNKRLSKRTVFWRYREEKAARKEQWKFYCNREGKKYLFDLSNDISEKNNLNQKYPEILSQLEREFSNWEKDVDEGVTFLTR
jgi:arylsulfatase A-like enzyme